MDPCSDAERRHHAGREIVAAGDEKGSAGVRHGEAGHAAYAVTFIRDAPAAKEHIALEEDPRRLGKAPTG